MFLEVDAILIFVSTYGFLFHENWWPRKLQHWLLGILHGFKMDESRGGRNQEFLKICVLL